MAGYCMGPTAQKNSLGDGFRHLELPMFGFWYLILNVTTTQKNWCQDTLHPYTAWELFLQKLDLSWSNNSNPRLGFREICRKRSRNHGLNRQKTVRTKPTQLLAALARRCHQFPQGRRSRGFFKIQWCDPNQTVNKTWLREIMGKKHAKQLELSIWFGKTCQKN